MFGFKVMLWLSESVMPADVLRNVTIIMQNSLDSGRWIAFGSHIQGGSALYRVDEIAQIIMFPEIEVAEEL